MRPIISQLVRWLEPDPASRMSMDSQGQRDKRNNLEIYISAHSWRRRVLPTSSLGENKYSDMQAELSSALALSVLSLCARESQVIVLQSLRELLLIQESQNSSVRGEESDSWHTACTGRPDEESRARRSAQEMKRTKREHTSVPIGTSSSSVDRSPCKCFPFTHLRRRSGELFNHLVILR